MSTKGTLASTALAGGAILMLTAVAAAFWWNPAPVSRSSEVINALSLAVPTLLIATYFGAIGIAVWVLLPNRGLSFVSLGLFVGIGLAAGSLAIALVHGVAGSSTVLLVPLPVASILVLAGFVVVRIRAGSVSTMTRRIRDVALSATVRSGDLIVIALTAAVLFSVARFGATAWTASTNDFHRYAGSALVWLSDSGVGLDFATQHPDAFGSGMIDRASGEKPAVTAMLVAASQVTGLAPYQLLTPLSIVLMAVLMSSLVVAVRSMFSVTPLWALVFVAAPSLSVIPLSRVFDAQLGHLAAVAMVAVAIAVSTQLRPHGGWRAWGPWTLVLAITLACAFATNFTLVLGSVPLIAALILWQLVRNGWLARGVAALAAVSLVLVAGLSVPLVDGYRRGFIGQATGAEGARVPFPSPLALVGQQVDLVSGTDGAQVVLEWLIVLAAAFTLLLPRIRRSIDLTMVLVVAVVAIVTTVALSVLYGWTNYIVHKSVATTIALAVPLIVVTVLTGLHDKDFRPVRVAAALLSGSALVIASFYGYGVRYVIPQSLVALQSDPRLAELPALNVDLDNYYLNSIGGLVPSSHSVRVVGRTYAKASVPVGDTFLIPSTMFDRKSWTSVTPLNADFAIANLDLTLGAGRVGFVAGDTSGRDLLFGSWFLPEVTGTWSTNKDAFIVFDPDSTLGTGDIVVTITGTHYADATQPRTLRFTANGVDVSTITSTDAVERDYRLVIPRDLFIDGRVAIGFDSDQTLTPLSLGGNDGRNLIFRATSMLVEAG